MAYLWFNVLHYAVRPWPWIIVAVASLASLSMVSLYSALKLHVDRRLHARLLVGVMFTPTVLLWSSGLLKEAAAVVALGMAVAGFAESNLSITVEDRQLVIRGRQSDDSEGRVFLHRGIAGRQFQRSFVLADGVEVGEALMENGLLHVDLTQAKPETVVQTINIRKG